MPMYEFRCGACGERFEALVEVGTESSWCRAVTRLAHPGPLAQAAPFGLVQTFGQARKRERANAELHAKAKATSRPIASRRASAKAPTRRD